MAQIPRREYIDLLCMYCCDFASEPLRLRCGHIACKDCVETRGAHALGVLLTDNPPDEIARDYPRPVFCAHCHSKEIGVTNHADIVPAPEIAERIREFSEKFGIEPEVANIDLTFEGPICTPHKAPGVKFDFDTNQVLCETCCTEGMWDDQKVLPIDEAMVRVKERCEKALERCKVFQDNVNSFAVIDFEEMKMRKKEEIHKQFEQLHDILRKQEEELRAKVKDDRAKLQEDYKKVGDAIAVLKEELKVSIKAMKRAEESGNAEWIAGVNARGLALNKEVGEMFNALLSREYKIELVKLVDLEKEIIFEVKKPEFGRRVTDKKLISKYLIAYYRDLAERGDSWGQYMYGMCLYNGEGVEIDQDAGKRYLNQASEQGNENAKAELKRLH